MSNVYGSNRCYQAPHMGESGLVGREGCPEQKAQLALKINAKTNFGGTGTTVGPKTFLTYKSWAQTDAKLPHMGESGLVGATQKAQLSSKFNSQEGADFFLEGTRANTRQ